jgi:Fic family protein
VARIERLWAMGRERVLRELPPPPESPPDRRAYLEQIDDIYEHDAYHSLSIEGYRVTPDLIERVASGDWDPEANEAHRWDRDALAARGYYQAFKLVRTAIEASYQTSAPTFIRTDHRAWYRELFAPRVTVGRLDAAALAGYRQGPVFLKGSRHVPPRAEALQYAMPALFDLLEAEPDTAARAVLGHWLFGYLHPFPDGNGRVARFIMNTALATAGYPWTVIRVEERKRYLDALERASVEGDVGPFAAFVAAQMRWTVSLLS